MPNSKTVLILAIISIIAAGFLSYANSLNNKFIWDDYFLVRDNKYIRVQSSMGNIFKGDVGAGYGHKYGFFRPLQILSYRLNYWFSGLNLRAYHLTNIALHILVALTLYWFIFILFSDRLLSLVTSLLFVTHPVHTEAITYISGRSDPLAALFMLLCLIFYIRYLVKSGALNYLLMVITCICALMSRENSLILPLLILMYHYIFGKKIKIKSLSLVLGLTILYISFRLTILSSVLPSKVSTTLWERLPGFFVALTNYLKLLLLPYDLHMEYGQKLFSFTAPEAIFGLFVFFSLVSWAFFRKNTHRLKSFAIFWFFIGLLPSTNLYPVNAYMAEHWLYFPSIGLFLLVSWALCSLSKIKKLSVLIISCFLTVLVFYSFFSLRQNEYWSDPLIFYKRTIGYNPQSSRLYANLGNTYMERGKPEAALVYYKKALSIDPQFAKMYYNIGNVYAGLGDYGRARENYVKSIKIDPSFANAHFNLGVVYSKIFDDARAIEEYQKVIEINPRHAKAHNNLAVAYYHTKQYNQAVRHCEEALSLGYSVNQGFLNLLKPFRKR